MKKQGGLILNIDINSVVTPFLNRVAELSNPTREDLYPFIDQYANTDITAIAFCVFCQYSSIDTAVWDDYADLYNRKRENGFDVNYEDRYRGIYRLNKQFGLDPFKIWMERCQELGMEAWFSIRMNDCHQPEGDKQDTYFIRSEFFYTARENGWLVGDRYGYYRICYNYAVPQVRRKMLDYIGELLANYNIDALELDFQREIVCFDYVNCTDCAEIMNGFIREVSGLVSEAGAKRGHKISLSARLSRDINQSKIYGFDAETWAKAGIVDDICVTPRWATNDSDMPMEVWREKLPNVTLSAGIETLCLQQKDEALTDTAIVAGLAAQYFTRGADRIYVYNHFIDPGAPVTNRARNLKAEFNFCGTPEKVISSHRRHIVMWQDIAPIGEPTYHPLPMNVSGEAELGINLGFVPSGRKASLVVGFSEGCPASVEICLDGEKCTGFAPTDVYCGQEFVDEPAKNTLVSPETRLYRCDIVLPQGDGYRTVKFTSEKAKVEYVEIEIE